MYTEKLNLDALRALFKEGKAITVVDGVASFGEYSADVDDFKMHLIEERLMMQVSNKGNGVYVYTKTEDFYPIPL